MDLEPDNAHTRKKSRGGWASAVVMPEFGGLRVVELDRGDSFAIGDLIPWDDVSFRRHQGGTSVIATPDGQTSMLVSVQGGGRAIRLSERLKARSIRRLVHTPVVVFEPVRELFKSYLIPALIVIVMMGGASLFLLVDLVLRSPPLPWGASDTVKFVVFAAMYSLPLLVVPMIWRARPHEPQFDRVAISEHGFQMELDKTGLRVEQAWEDVLSSKRIRSDRQLRFRLDLIDGDRHWLVIPSRSRDAVLGRMPVSLGGLRTNPNKERAAARWLIVRLVLMAVIISSGWWLLTAWLMQRGIVSPAHISRPRIGVTVLILVFYAVILTDSIFARWRKIPRTRRRLRRWSRRIGMTLRPNMCSKPSNA